MRKQAIHVKSYNRSRHGRADHGGRVCSHDKSGRAKYIVIRAADKDVGKITEDMIGLPTKGFGVWSEKEAKAAVKKLPQQLFYKSGRADTETDRKYRAEIAALEKLARSSDKQTREQAKAILEYEGKDVYSDELSDFVHSFVKRGVPLETTKEIVKKQFKGAFRGEHIENAYEDERALLPVRGTPRGHIDEDPWAKFLAIDAAKKKSERTLFEGHDKPKFGTTYKFTSEDGTTFQIAEDPEEAKSIWAQRFPGKKYSKVEKYIGSERQFETELVKGKPFVVLKDYKSVYQDV